VEDYDSLYDLDIIASGKDKDIGFFKIGDFEYIYLYHKSCKKSDPAGTLTRWIHKDKCVSCKLPINVPKKYKVMQALSEMKLKKQ